MRGVCHGIQTTPSWSHTCLPCSHFAAVLPSHLTYRTGSHLDSECSYAHGLRLRASSSGIRPLPMQCVCHKFGGVYVSCLSYISHIYQCSTEKRLRTKEIFQILQPTARHRFVPSLSVTLAADVSQIFRSYESFQDFRVRSARHQYRRFMPM